MGKGFNNYMCKKFFHPASRDNLKRVWMAEQQTAAYKQKQEELRVQYEKEQDLYTNKAIMSKESKEKLSVNFLYEPPPGTKKDREREDDEPEFKFEWQRRYNAPRESYCKGDQEIRDQPFGIQVRNVRCIKCHKWGHINTDKECPMYNQSASGADGASSLNPSELIRQMREDGLAMKKGAVGLLELPNTPANISSHQLIPSSSEDEDHMNESELKFLEGLSTKKKMKLLKKLEKMERKKKKKMKEKKDKHKEGIKKKSNYDSDSSENSDSPAVKKKLKEAARNGLDIDKKAFEVSQDNKGHFSGHHPGIREVENDLYTVLGRKLDFEGPPRSRLMALSDKPASKDRRRHSRSRSRSKSPKDRRGFQPKSKEDSDRPHSNSRRARRPSRSPEEHRSVPGEKYGRVSRRERSLSREKNGRVSRRERSLSREKNGRSHLPSRESRRQSRSPVRKEVSRNHKHY